MEEKTKKIRYQLYKPELKEYDTVELEIIGSHEIPCSLYKRYSVTVCHKSPGRKQEHLTSKKMSLWGPLKWNEKFTFRREKSSQDWTFDFQLKATSWLSVSLVGKKTEVLKKIGEAINVELVKSNDTKINLEVRLEEKESKQDVRIRDQEHLCDDENKFCGERKSVIQKSHFFTEILTDQTQKEHLPNIAVIGSGGGMRAVQGMSGAVIALDEAHILDAVMYMAGVSGSSWYISTLYASSKDKLRPLHVMKSIRKRINGVFQEAAALARSLTITGIRQFCHTGKYWTFTNVYGNVIGDILLKKKKNLKWSSQTARLNKGEVPLPLLAMLHVYDKDNPEDLNEWIECSPFEAFMPKYGVGIDMKHFGSEFDGGFVKKTYPEEPVHFLQGICGSAYISVLNPKPKDSGRYCCFRKHHWGYFIESYLMESMAGKCVGEIPNWLYGVSIKELHDENISREREHISEDDINRMKKVITDISRTEVVEQDIERMKNVIGVISDTNTQSYIRNRADYNSTISEDDVTSLNRIHSEISRNDISEADIYSMNRVFKEISTNDLKLENLPKANTYLTDGDIISMKKVVDNRKEALMLTDAGIAFNSPYPLVLHPARKIDLILSFEFSAPDPAKLSEWPFSELKKAEKWAKCRNIPFPDLSKIDEYKTRAIENLYIFRGDKAPTIMHFVMYEKRKPKELRTESESNVEDIYLWDYRTFKFNYSNEEFDWLSNLMKTIVEHNVETIKAEIRSEIAYKQSC